MMSFLLSLRAWNFRYGRFVFCSVYTTNFYLIAAVPMLGSLQVKVIFIFQPLASSLTSFLLLVLDRLTIIDDDFTVESVSDGLENSVAIARKFPMQMNALHHRQTAPTCRSFITWWCKSRIMTHYWPEDVKREWLWFVYTAKIQRRAKRILFSSFF